MLFFAMRCATTAVCYLVALDAAVTRLPAPTLSALVCCIVMWGWYLTPNLHSQDLPAQWLEAVLARGGLSGEIEADLRELIDPNSIDVPTYGHRPATRGCCMAEQPPSPACVQEAT
jgi:hypothetical protein